MDIRKILEAKKREIEAKLQVKQNGEMPVKIPPSSRQASPGPSSLHQTKDEEIGPEMVDIIEKVAQAVAQEGPSLEDKYRRECAVDGGSAHPYQFLLHPKWPEYLLYQQRLHKLTQIDLLANSSKRKHPDEATFCQPSQSGTLDAPNAKKRSSRWGPQPESPSAVTCQLNEEQASALQLMHLRQQLAARDMALTARAGVAEMKLDLPSSEHRMRALEMEKTKEKAQKLTKSLSEGKHHMQDFLPKEELLKFVKTRDPSSPAPPTAQYEDNKLTETNLGYQMLKKFGWSEGKGLGTAGTGISAPINSVAPIERAGLGTKKPDEPTEDDDEFTLYRKRMMTAYKYRPNPLNNPRRPYY